MSHKKLWLKYKYGRLIKMEMRKTIRKITKEEFIERENELIKKSGTFISNEGSIIKMPYSLIPTPFFERIEYITYPEVKPNMYIINTKGMIFNAITKAQLTSYNKGNGYYAVTLQTGNGGKIFLVHRLVAYQFCNPPVDFNNKVVNHINGNRYNNEANNLEWVTVAANNQHSIEVHTGGNTFIVNNRPVVNEKFVRYLCEEFEKGKSNTDIMRELGLKINNSNHTLLRDIRGGYTWAGITREYNFNRSSKKHAYTKEEREIIKTYIRQGKTDKEIFAIMNGREYVANSDRLDSSYRTINTIRVSLL